MCNHRFRSWTFLGYRIGIEDCLTTLASCARTREIEKKCPRSLCWRARGIRIGKYYVVRVIVCAAHGQQALLRRLLQEAEKLRTWMNTQNRQCVHTVLIKELSFTITIDSDVGIQSQYFAAP